MDDLRDSCGDHGVIPERYLPGEERPMLEQALDGVPRAQGVELPNSGVLDAILPENEPDGAWAQPDMEQLLHHAGSVLRAEVQEVLQVPSVCEPAYNLGRDLGGLPAIQWVSLDNTLPLERGDDVSYGENRDQVAVVLRLPLDLLDGSLEPPLGLVLDSRWVTKGQLQDLQANLVWIKRDLSTSIAHQLLSPGLTDWLGIEPCLSHLIVVALSTVALEPLFIVGRMLRTWVELWVLLLSSFI